MRTQMVHFSSRNHTYWCDGKRVPSVTEILKTTTIINTRFYTENGRVRGQLVHQACEDIDRGNITADRVSPALHPYCVAYEQFLHEHDVRYSAIEQILYHEKLMYAGTCDRIGYLDGQRVILDIKSGRPEPWHGVQLAAYELCLPYEGSKRVALRLKPDGQYRLVEYFLVEETAIWLAALDAWRIRHRLKPIVLGVKERTAL